MNKPKQVGVVVVGEVDHGKSTLLGRLLLDSGKVPDDKVTKVARICESRILPFEPAFLLDALEEEHAQNVTIDTTRVLLDIGEREILLIDAPGHLGFLKNMSTGASEADLALAVIDVTEGVREQTFRHLRVLELLGITDVIVVLNKADKIDFAEARCKEVAESARKTVETAGLRCRGAVPVSALLGKNIESSCLELTWYSGGSLLSAIVSVIEESELPTALDQPLRMVLQDVYRFGDERYLAGRVGCGALHQNMNIRLSPSGKCGTIASIHKHPSQIERAAAGESIAITLHDQIFVERGEVISPEHSAPVIDSEIPARILWFSDEPYHSDVAYLLKIGSQESRCVLVFLNQEEEEEEEEEAKQREKCAHFASTRQIRNGSISDVLIRVNKPLAFDSDLPGSPINRLVICSDTESVACGRVHHKPLNSLERKSHPSTYLPFAVPRAKRELKQGHKGCVLWITGLSGSGKSTLAEAIETALYEQNRSAVTLDADNLRKNLCSDLKFSRADRSENVRRIASTAKLFLEMGSIVIVACISPYEADRKMAREIIGETDFREIFLFCAVEVCSQRDPKGLYKEQRKGTVSSLPGLDAPFQPPVNPDLRLDSSALSVQEEVKRVMELLQSTVF